jgi:hypothetical protein
MLIVFVAVAGLTVGFVTGAVAHAAHMRYHSAVQVLERKQHEADLQLVHDWRNPMK